MPQTEIIPFVATSTGAPFTAFGLALVAHDGVVEVIAIMFTLGVLGAGGYVAVAGLGA